MADGFSEKEKYMMVMNDFVRDQQVVLKKYFDIISAVDGGKNSIETISKSKFNMFTVKKSLSPVNDSEGKDVSLVKRLYRMVHQIRNAAVSTQGSSANPDQEKLGSFGSLARLFVKPTNLASLARTIVNSGMGTLKNGSRHRPNAKSNKSLVEDEQQRITEEEISPAELKAAELQTLPPLRTENNRNATADPPSASKVSPVVTYETNKVPDNGNVSLLSNIRDIKTSTPKKPSLLEIRPNVSPEGFDAKFYTLDFKGKGDGDKKPVSAADQDKLKIKKAWEAALAPAKAVPMNALMLWMSGSQLQIYSFMMLFMLFSNGVQGIAKVSQTFERFAVTQTGSNGDPVLLPKAIFVVLQLAVIGLGVWKMSSMGLLPTAQSDWLAFLQPKQYSEFSGGPIS
ncbi:hypothetical protein HDU93_001925 [Gonapodya sp. JEL0774]|nr:hypothetical protein HDU93_001925 [Gonapodya sp. JEL0774]